MLKAIILSFRQPYKYSVIIGQINESIQVDFLKLFNEHLQCNKIYPLENILFFPFVTTAEKQLKNSPHTLTLNNFIKKMSANQIDTIDEDFGNRIYNA
jgi:hypothetical protein